MATVCRLGVLGLTQRSSLDRTLDGGSASAYGRSALPDTA